MAISFESILKVLRDTNKTEFQKAADLHALASEDVADGNTPIAPAPAKRGRKPRAAAPNGFEHHETSADTALPGMNE